MVIGISILPPAFSLWVSKAYTHHTQTRKQLPFAWKFPHPLAIDIESEGTCEWVLGCKTGSLTLRGVGGGSSQGELVLGSDRGKKPGAGGWRPIINTL